jgi:hypothetical protein
MRTGRQVAAPRAPAARPAAAPRRCMAPSREPAEGAARPPPSLQSIEEGGHIADGYVSPMLSFDWGDSPAFPTAAGVPAAADPLHLGARRAVRARVAGGAGPGARRSARA